MSESPYKTIRVDWKEAGRPEEVERACRRMKAAGIRAARARDAAIIKAISEPEPRRDANGALPDYALPD